MIHFWHLQNSLSVCQCDGKIKSLHTSHLKNIHVHRTIHAVLFEASQQKKSDLMGFTNQQDKVNHSIRLLRGRIEKHLVCVVIWCFNKKCQYSHYKCLLFTFMLCPSFFWSELKHLGASFLLFTCSISAQSLRVSLTKKTWLGLCHWDLSGSILDSPFCLSLDFWDKRVDTVAACTTALKLRFLFWTFCSGWKMMT